MTTALEVRASGAPLAFACPGSVRAPVLPVSDESGAARLGTAAHVALRDLVETGAINWAQIPELAARYDVNPDELRALCGMATKLWPTLAPSFPNAMTELALDAELVTPRGTPYALTGHIDLISIRGTVARAGDWKTGRRDSNYAQQMRAYAALLLLEDPDLTEATSTVIWVRDGEVESYTMDRAKLAAWRAELETHVIDWDGVFHPSTDGCGFCRRSHECDA